VRNYFYPKGGMSEQRELLTSRAIFTEAYVVIPKGVMQDIVVSYLPFWENTRVWILSRPLSGFAETFSQYIVELAPGGGSERPELEAGVESALFVVDGEVFLRITGTDYRLRPGHFAYLPPDSSWQVRNHNSGHSRFHWIRKAYDFVEGLDLPEPIIVHEDDVDPEPMPNSGGRWATTRFVDPQDLRHEMHITIVTLQPGAVIPFAETHVMEHGLYVLQGKGVYRLNQDWVEVEAGDYMWLRAFCPQACYAGGPEPFRYLLYKDVNRHAKLRRGALLAGATS